MGKRFSVLKKMKTNLLVILLALMGLSGIARPEEKTDRPCETLAMGKPIDEHIGRAVSFFGSALWTNNNPEGDKVVRTFVWVCKSRDGATEGKAIFAVFDSDSKWTPAAEKANRLKDLFRVTGIVRKRVLVRLDGSPALAVLIADARIELASEVK